jgi:hypothetical protein
MVVAVEEITILGQTLDDAFACPFLFVSPVTKRATSFCRVNQHQTGKKGKHLNGELHVATMDRRQWGDTHPATYSFGLLPRPTLSDYCTGC